MVQPTEKPGYCDVFQLGSDNHHRAIVDAAGQARPIWGPGHTLHHLALEQDRAGRTRLRALLGRSTPGHASCAPRARQARSPNLHRAWSRSATRLAWGGTAQEGAQTSAPSTVLLKGKMVQSVAWSPDGTRLACGIDDGTVVIVTA